jgi:hypothetical protein
LSIPIKAWMLGSAENVDLKREVYSSNSKALSYLWQTRQQRNRPRDDNHPQDAFLGVYRIKRKQYRVESVQAQCTQNVSSQ